MMSIKAQLKRKLESAQQSEYDDEVIYKEMCKYFAKQLGIYDKLKFDHEVTWNDVKTLFEKAKSTPSEKSSSSSPGLAPDLKKKKTTTPVSTPGLPPDSKKKLKSKEKSEADKATDIPDMNNTVSPDSFSKEFLSEIISGLGGSPSSHDASVLYGMVN